MVGKAEPSTSYLSFILEIQTELAFLLPNLPNLPNAVKIKKTLKHINIVISLRTF